MAFFLFLAWMLPVLLGSISFGVGTNDALYRLILAASPITGIAMSTGLIEKEGAQDIAWPRSSRPRPSPSSSFSLLVATQVQDRAEGAVGLPRPKPADPFGEPDAAIPTEKAVIDVRDAMA